MSRKGLVIRNERLRKYLEHFRARKEPPPPRTQVRYRNRCRLCGRPRGYIRYVGLCRICFRELVHKGYFPGFRKASW